jgi:hypothetical protein
MNGHGKLEKDKLEFFKACKNGELDRVKTLFDETSTRKDLARFAIDGDSALHAASRKGRVQVVKHLLSYSEYYIDFTSGVSFSTPLLLACTLDTNSELVEFLLNKGARRDAVNKDLKNILHKIFEAGSWKIFRLILDKYSIEEILALLHQVDSSCKSPLEHLDPEEAWSQVWSPLKPRVEDLQGYRDRLLQAWVNAHQNYLTVATWNVGSFWNQNENQAYSLITDMWENLKDFDTIFLQEVLPNSIEMLIHKAKDYNCLQEKNEQGICYLTMMRHKKTEKIQSKISQGCFVSHYQLPYSENICWINVHFDPSKIVENFQMLSLSKWKRNVGKVIMGGNFSCDCTDTRFRKFLEKSDLFVDHSEVPTAAHVNNTGMAKTDFFVFDPSIELLDCQVFTYVAPGGFHYLKVAAFKPQSLQAEMENNLKNLERRLKMFEAEISIDTMKEKKNPDKKKIHENAIKLPYFEHK